MSKASLLPAVGAGFGLIAREPLSVLVWGLLVSLLTFGPVLPLLWADGVFEFYGQLMIDPMSVSGVPPALAQYQALQVVQLFAAIAMIAVIYPAIMRAVLFPEQRAWAYLRLGRDEFHIGVIGVVLYVMLIVVMIAVMFVVVVPLSIAAAASAAANIGSLIGMIVLGVLLVVLISFLFAAFFLGRLWISAPMSLAEGQLTVFGGWGLTRGYAWRLFGMAVLVILITFGVQLIIYAIVALAMWNTVGGLEGLAQGWWEMKTPLLGGYLAAGAIGAVLLTPIMIAPWARAYQILAARKDEESGQLFA